MSDGNFEAQNPMRDIRFDGPTLMASLTEERAAIRDAEGDVRGASERLREQVHTAQGEVRTARDSLTERQREMLAKAEQMELVGRTIDIEEGESVGEIRFVRGVKPTKYVLPVSKDLDGVKGTISGASVGTKSPNGAGELLLHVDVKGRIFPPRAFRRYVLRASGATFTTGKAPEHQDQ